MAARDALDTARAASERAIVPALSANAARAAYVGLGTQGVVSWVACWTGAVELCESIPRRREDDSL
jgi:hypothetical protein